MREISEEVGFVAIGRQWTTLPGSWHAHIIRPFQMHTPRIIRLILKLLTVMMCLVLERAPQARAQSVQTLYQFTSLSGTFANVDGAFPGAALTDAGNVLYGTATQGGSDGGGTIFQISTNGTSFRVLHNFIAPNPNSGDPGDGAYPLSAVIINGTELYGTTSAGGPLGSGIAFRIKSDGTGFTTLHSFTAVAGDAEANTDGAFPWGGLLLVGNTLYGTASRGGDAGSGTVYKLNTDGTGFSRLHSFGALDAGGNNTDGAYPLSSLILWSNALYGTTYRGGTLGTGTVFRVNLDGTGFTTLQHLGGGPRGSLLVSSNALYGTTDSGGSFGGGTIFRLNADGSGFTNLENFANDPGNGPWSGLVQDGNKLFGTTYAGGDLGLGSLFSIQGDGTGFTNYYSFTGGADGSHPQGAPTPGAGGLFGTASEGGAAGNGTVFALQMAPVGSPLLSITVSGNQVIVRWPANVGGTLQSTTSLGSPINWAPVSPGPTVVNGENVVTNSIAGATRFFRLGP
jgi:uncharacterized repeat protein (TIGR03803 family)